MITTQVTFSDFWGWLQSSDSYKNNFSYEGAKALFEYLEEASDNGEPSEADNYDPVAWCVEFTEFKDFKNWKTNFYGTDDTPIGQIKDLGELNNHTIVVNESPLVIADF